MDTVKWFNNSISSIDGTRTVTTTPGQSVVLLAGTVEYPPNDCPGYDTKQSDGEAPVNGGALENVEYPFIAITPRSTLTGVVVPDRVPSIDRIELNCVLMLNWIVLNRTVFDIDTVYLSETELFEIELFGHLTACKQKILFS